MKTYKLTIVERDDHQVEITCENNGFNAAELVGYFELKKQDTIDQMNDCRKGNVKFNRTAIVDGVPMKIEENHEG